MNQTGGTRYPRANSGWALEISLDVQTAHGICPSCKILLVEASSATMANLGTAVNKAVRLGATVVSNSYGGDESSSETSDDSAYFNHPGVAITVSSGDSGYGVEYPAASRYVTAVGGTTLNLNADNSYESETAWSGSGSGCSAYVTKPSWQTDTGCARRTVADVSADADPEHRRRCVRLRVVPGAERLVPGRRHEPRGSADRGRLRARRQRELVSYGSYPYGHTSSLHDVTSGSNGSCGGSYLCTAGSGYDGPTGLGSPSGTGGF